MREQGAPVEGQGAIEGIWHGTMVRLGAWCLVARVSMEPRGATREARGNMVPHGGVRVTGESMELGGRTRNDRREHGTPPGGTVTRESIEPPEGTRSDRRNIGRGGTWRSREKKEPPWGETGTEATWHRTGVYFMVHERLWGLAEGL